MSLKTVIAIYFVCNLQLISFHHCLHVQHCIKKFLGVVGPFRNDISILVVAHHLVFYSMQQANIDPLETCLFIFE